ncbi:MAG: lytic transglycosylase domain-containing protein [Alphaproteobacteria bacterium]
MLLLLAAPALADVPAVTSDADAQRYEKIFALQDKADFRAADRLIRQLDDRLLMGHVLFQRYMHPAAYRSRYAELRDWLKHYGDHPGADRVHKLALKRKPNGAAAPPQPRAAPSPRGFTVDDSEMTPHLEHSTEAANLRADLEGRVVRGRLDDALAGLAAPRSKRLLDQVDRDRLSGMIAGVKLRRGEIEAALKLAVPAARRSGGQAPNALWIAGLACWQQGDFAAALGHWRALSEAKAARAPLRAAGAYWSARALLRLERPAEVIAALQQAAGYPRQLYGVIASAQLGLPTPLNLTPIARSADVAERLLRHAGARRAVALARVGRTRRADLELRQLFFANRHLAEPLLALAHDLELPGSQLRLAEAMRKAGEATPDLALFPVPPWRPQDGLRVDRALLLAVARYESGFEPRALNPSGAAGLMQIMPSTADFVHGRSLAGARWRMLDPGFNLELGQRYLEHLLREPRIDGGLIQTIAAYNAGPSNLVRWLHGVAHGDDPLLFIELIPTRQTRRYVRRVLADVMLYRIRLGQPAPELLDIAQARWPRYESVDEERKHAWNR